MRRIIFTIIIIMSISGIQSALAEESVRQLPQPQKSGGPSVLEAIDCRNSGASFSGEVSDADLATILWAGTGRNRNDGGWTIPLASGRPPYVDIYVAGQNGVYRYGWHNNTLIPINPDDVRDKVATQSFIKKAYYFLIFVIDAEKAQEASKQRWKEIGDYAIGAMSQNIYLAADALKIKTRFMMSINDKDAAEQLHLEGSDVPACIMALGR